VGGGFQAFQDSAIAVPPVRTPPVRPYPPPGASTPPNLVGPSSELTPPIIKELSAKSFKTGRWYLRAGEYKSIEVDRPTLLWLVASNGGVWPTTNEPLIFYNWGSKPETNTQVQFADKGGLVFLSAPGTWWITTITTDADLLIIDAWNPAEASKYFNLPGSGIVSESNVAVTSTAAATQLLPANRYRKAVTLQNVKPLATAGQVVRVSINQATSYLATAGAWTGAGISLAVGASITFSGDGLGFGDINAVLESAGSTNVEVLEFRDGG